MLLCFCQLCWETEIGETRSPWLSPKARETLKTLRITLVDETRTENPMIKESLEVLGHGVVEQLVPNQDLLSHVRSVAPDMLVINVKMPDHALLQNITEVNRIRPMPVVLFAEIDSQNMVESIIESGVSAYVVDGLEAGRLEPIVNVAMVRFAQMQGLRKELADT